jgi:DNA polymerase I-like protein with 3'-5' exonuclease and polymerase domains
MLVIDTETTILNKGNPFDFRNRCCYIGCFDGDTYNLLDLEYTDKLKKENLVQSNLLVSNHSLVVAFNAKFDLHWLRRYGIDFSHCDVWDCQLVEFILSHQTTPYPSLDSVADHYGLGHKLNIVETEYWSKGIDTPDVPRDILEEYLTQDLNLTYQIYLKQLEQVNEQP